ncbi:resolvase [Ochrobactrum sp. MYb29]|nr:resolvase [Ochrobactrum sp. MYb29]
MNHIPLARLYLRASTKEQDATRALSELKAKADELGFRVAATYIENESGASLKRPELFKLLEDSSAGDLLFVEQVDRLSRLSEEDWRTLRKKIDEKQIHVVALDLPTSQRKSSDDEFTEAMLKAVNSMMLDMLAAIARKDYLDRRRRQAQGIVKAKAEGRYKGKPEDLELQSKIRECLSKGFSYRSIQSMLDCSRTTIAKVSRLMKD